MSAGPFKLSLKTAGRSRSRLRLDAAAAEGPVLLGLHDVEGPVGEVLLGGLAFKEAPLTFCI